MWTLLSLYWEQSSILLAHMPEQVLSKGDCVNLGLYSEVMIAQFILNCRLFK